MTEQQAKKKRRERGQIIPRGENTFQIRVPTGRDPATGSRLYHTETLHGTRTQAEKRRTKLLAQIDDGTFIEPSRASLEAYFKEWLDQKRRDGIREITLQGYRDTVDIYILPRIGAKRLAKITPRDVQSIYNHMQDRGLSPVTIKGVRRVLKMAFTQAVAWRYIAVNPAAEIKVPAMPDRDEPAQKGRAMDEAEARTFLEAAHEQPDDLIFVLWLFTGLRPEEMIGLQWSQLELVREFDGRRETFIERGIARIRRTVVLRRGGGWYFSKPKSPSSLRDVYFPASIYHDLMKHKERQAAQARATGLAWTDNDLVFTVGNGQPLDRANLLRRRLRPLLKHAGLSEEFTLYSLRYTYATLSLLAGESDKVISEQMGHKRVDFTKNVYTRVLPVMKQTAAERLEKLLFSDAGTPTAHIEAQETM
jgi:integrase